MTPRDWMLIVRGHREALQSTKPGANAPSDAEMAALLEKYG